MLALALCIGGYAYTIFFLGLLHLLYPDYIKLVSFVWSGVLVYIAYYLWHRQKKSTWTYNRSCILLLLLVCLLWGVNLIGALGPQTAFDAIWYHLTLPKLFTQSHAIFFIPGGLLYYSVMPKLVELLYIPALSLGNSIVPAGIHYGFGILSCIALYKLSRRFLSPFYSILAVIVFSSNLVVAWEATTAYIDLGRTFFEIMAIWMWVIWVEKKQLRYFFASACMVGLAITSKLIAIGSLGIIVPLTLYVWHIKKYNRFVFSILYSVIALLIPSPWFIFSFLATGNPVYPLLSHTYPITTSFAQLNPINFLVDSFGLLVHASDPVSPFYLLCIPFVGIGWKHGSQLMRYLIVYCGLALVIWYLTPQTGGGRFILPYLPIFSLVSVSIVYALRSGFLKKLLLGTIIFLAFVTIFYRGVANAKYLPVIVGKETSASFLTHHLTFSFGDFYDTDGYFARTIKSTDRVLLVGFHNLYYVNFPFIDSSWVKPTDTYKYIAVQHGTLKENPLKWQLIYTNTTTDVRVYKRMEK